MEEEVAPVRVGGVERGRRGDRLRDGLQARFDASPLPFCVTGWGSLLCIHPVASPAEIDEADVRWRDLFFHDLLEAGFYTAPRGMVALSMDVSDDDTGRFLTAVEAFCDERATLR